MKVKHGYLYLADLNPQFGPEAGKSRPVLVIQTDLLNQFYHSSTWVLPCTTKLVGENILRVFVASGCAGNSFDCEVMIDQSRSIDNKRFKKELKKLPLILFREIKDKLRLLGEF
ncbi:MAG: type II toxin-antitoxin system PemK/MazF family toxin [Deltaproteobacteria bacterium]|nr:type II toxin-antitoxin system PemK/MazF family toxin [Deltaproteobacteria bacterium]